MNFTIVYLMAVVLQTGGWFFLLTTGVYFMNGVQSDGYVSPGVILCGCGCASMLLVGSLCCVVLGALR